MPETSIIIRVRNQEKWLEECLKRIFEQTYQNFEVLVIDNESNDRTLEIAEKFPVRIFHIKKEDFSFPYASNFGCRQAKAEKYFVFLSGHSLPISKTWLADGISNFTSSETMGVYGPVLALPDATFWEKLIFRRWYFKEKAIIVNNGKMGVMGATNAIFRKDLWEKQNFDERYGIGGEDTIWARHWLAKGYVAVRDPKFAVFHSHGLGLLGLIKQYKYWKKTISAPHPFKREELKFRKIKE